MHNDLNIVIVGHVDHGKSTVIGRLLADTGSLPQGKLEQIQEMCRRNSKPFEYAFLLDALKDERSQGITIDTARSFFKTDKRRYIIIDAPGHIEFLKNMITGASRAEAALLVIDAHEGIRENSRRHGYMLSMLGIKQVAVLVNKMDLAGYSEARFGEIREEYTAFLSQININPACFIPISAMEGDNIASQSPKMPWYQGATVLSQLDAFPDEELDEDKPLRMPVQDVYKFTAAGDDRRIIAGTIEAGSLRTGDEVIFFPSGKKTRVKSIEGFNQPPIDSISAGYSTGFTITEQIYVRRGELAARAGDHEPEVATKIFASVFWLGREPLKMDKSYFFKINTAKVSGKIAEIRTVLDASTLENQTKTQIERHEVAECVIQLDRPVAFDLAEEASQTSRFVIVDKYEISGGGIITAAMEDELTDMRQKVMLRNYKWEQSNISQSRRTERNNHKSALVLITGAPATDKKRIARALEEKLFSEGKSVYYLGIGNVLYGIDADIKHSARPLDREEHIRRLAEVSNIMLDAGNILIVTATELYQDDLEIFKLVTSSESILTCWIGEKVTTDINYSIAVSAKSPESAAVRIKDEMEKQGILFRAW